MHIKRVLPFVVRLLTLSCIAAQKMSSTGQERSCAELSGSILNQTAFLDSKKTEEVVSAALACPKDISPACAGMVLSDLSASMGTSGRFAEAVRYGERAIETLEKIAGVNAPVLLRPLEIMALAQLEQNNVRLARNAFQRMLRVPAKQPESRARIHQVGAVLLEKEGRSAEAESEYLQVLSALDEAGRGNSADAASTLTALASLYLKVGRLRESTDALDRASSIFDAADETVPMDRIKLLNMRALLHARQGEWQRAEDELERAISIADGQHGFDPVFHFHLLANYAQALRKNHHWREARRVEARAVAVRGREPKEALLDITQLSGMRRVPGK
jgi:tetratricopeptide (TPR) repeat protein